MISKHFTDLAEVSGPVVAATTNPNHPDGWQLAYTIARHEKVVAAQLRSRGIDSIVPVYKAIHRWNKRAVTLELPLFPSYVFLHCNPLNHYAVVSVPGLVSIVSFQGKPATVPHEELMAVLNALNFRNSQPCPYLALGKRVRITSGPLAGVVGVIERIKGLRVIVSVDCIASSVAIEANADDLALAA